MNKNKFQKYYPRSETFTAADHYWISQFYQTLANAKAVK